nr:hypothetical protein [Kibdelosporangium sp. MJ126-NF4]CTQ99152.1 hypothetical protein [Kibdelosporangium sp. MJ126-NF4]
MGERNQHPHLVGCARPVRIGGREQRAAVLVILGHIALVVCMQWMASPLRGGVTSALDLTKSGQ